MEVVKLLFLGITVPFLCRKKEKAELVCSPGRCVIQDTEISTAKKDTTLIRFWKLNLTPVMPRGKKLVSLSLSLLQ